MRFNQLHTICEGSLFQASKNDAEILHLLTDSRKMVFAEQGLFIAIKGVRNDGHLYLKEVYEQGVRLFLIEEGNYTTQSLTHLKEAGIFIVKNSLAALQAMAAYHRNLFSYPVTAITGSNGKTIVKEWLTHLLKEDFRIVRNPKSYNSQLGVPLSVWQMQENHQLAIFEAGISEPKEMQKLAAILKPKIGILTLIGDAHDEGFENKIEKLKEKMLLFDACEKVIYGYDQSFVKTHIQSQQVAGKYISWSKKNKEADYFISVQQETQNTELKLNQFTVRIPFTDEAAIWNACTCLAYLAAQNLLNPRIAERFAELPSLEMRLQLKEAQNNCILLNDAYSADTGSLAIALDFLQQHAAEKKRSVILSDFLESGVKEEELYQQIANQLKAHQITKFIGIGKRISAYQHLFTCEQKGFYEDTKSFLEANQLLDFSHEIILLKGARKFGFERIAKWFEKQVHQTVFEINLNALENNLNAYKKLLSPKVKVMAMVKAFSYGAGSYEIARILSYHRVDYLTVAYADEGVVLRKAGIQTPIMVMNPEPSSFDALLKHHLEPEIYQFDILNKLIEIADGEEIGIHLELDTGMKRLGFDAHEIPALLQLLKATPNLKVNSVFTHLAASEETAHDPFTLSQIEKFKQLSALICEAFPYPVLRHCLNSGGIARFKEAQFDMVRLGIGLYGIDPAQQKSLQLKPIGTLKTIISQIREIEANESIGYGRNGKLRTAGRIAIVAIGYADGLDRKLSNGTGYMLVNGQIAPIVGNICMDMTMLNISDIDCKVGDEVIVFGDKPSLHEISAHIGTIPYEVLTGVSQRVKRVYYYE
jgi:alanine racemase